MGICPVQFYMEANMAIQKAGVILLNTNNHKVGLVYRNKQNDYSFPKGHLEPNETLQQCAIRETAEETKRDCRLLSDNEIGVIRYNTTEQGDPCEVHMYVAIDTGHSDNTSWDTHDLKWVDWGSVEKKLTYQNLKDFWNSVKNTLKEPLGFLRSDVTRAHLGVYGIIKQNNQILLIKKARGPYTGLYDLPGGTPENNETPEETVTREIKEETNCDVISKTNKREHTVLFNQFTPASGLTGCMQHTGILFDITVNGNPATTGDGLDSNGAEWVDIDTLSPANASPFTLLACGQTNCGAEIVK